MSWLRIDDGFVSHPKLSGWSVGDKWALLCVLSYCARYDTDGRLPADVRLMGVTQRLVDLAEESGLLDRDKGGLVVHDWADYNPSGGSSAERMRRWRERHGVTGRDGTSDEKVTGRDVTSDAEVTSPSRTRVTRTRDAGATHARGPVPKSFSKAVTSRADVAHGPDFSSILKDVPR